MKLSLRKGFSYGLISAVITTLGLMVGLDVATSSKMVVLGGIILIAIADALSDSLGVHVSEEAENKHTSKEIWESTAATFFTKAAVSLTFTVPILLVKLSNAIIINIALGMFLISFFSFIMAKKQGAKIHYVVFEHLGIAIFVVALAHQIGHWVAVVFG